MVHPLLIEPLQHAPIDESAPRTRSPRIACFRCLLSLSAAPSTQTHRDDCLAATGRGIGACLEHDTTPSRWCTAAAHAPASPSAWKTAERALPASLLYMIAPLHDGSSTTVHTGMALAAPALHAAGLCKTLSGHVLLVRTAISSLSRGYLTRSCPAQECALLPLQGPGCGERDWGAAALRRMGPAGRVLRACSCTARSSSCSHFSRDWRGHHGPDRCAPCVL